MKGLARQTKLGQDPGVGDREREVEDEKLTEQEHEVAAREDSTTEDTKEEPVDLKKVAADYAQYLAVNSRQDGRIFLNSVKIVVADQSLAFYS